MALTKDAAIVVHDNITLTAGAADTVSSAQDLSAKYAAEALIKITNGATGPTIAAQVQISVSQDGTNYYNFGGALKGGTTNSGVYSWTIGLPFGAKYVKFTSGSNTGQNVTLRVELATVSAV